MLKNQADALEAVNKVAPAPANQVATFVKQTLPSYNAIPKAERAAMATEATQARTYDEFQKLQTKADSTQKSYVMAEATRSQALAMKQVTMADDRLKANEKLWTDPQHGYAQVSSAANLTKSVIKAGMDGAV